MFANDVLALFVKSDRDLMCNGTCDFYAVEDGIVYLELFFPLFVYSLFLQLFTFICFTR